MDLSRQHAAAAAHRPSAKCRCRLPSKWTTARSPRFIGYRVQHDNARGPMKGGPALSSRSRSRRSPLAGRADDLEDGRRQHSLRRRQGGHRRRPRKLSRRELERITRKFIDEHPRHDRPRHRHPRPRHGHQRRGDGLDHEPVQQVPRLQPGRASPASRSSCTASPAARKRPAAASAS